MDEEKNIIEMTKIREQVRTMKTDIKRLEHKVDELPDKLSSSLLPIIDLKIDNKVKRLETKIYGAVIGLVATVIIEITIMIVSAVVK